MKTSKLTSTLTTLSFVLFLSIASYANTSPTNTGDLPASGNKNLIISGTPEKDFSYLRFDATKYMNANEESDEILNDLNYLRFDVNTFINENESASIELPLDNEFDYLRFDVTGFTKSNSDTEIELPVNQYDYLRFNVADFSGSNMGTIDELPITE